jgi:hypothetical protein
MEGELWGLAEIAKHMGWRDLRTPVRAFEWEGFPMYKRRRGSHPRLWYFTTTRLVMAWMVARCGMDRERLQRQRAERRERRGSASDPRG